VGLFKLKVGSHVSGSGETMRFYDARDPLRNIVDTGEKGIDLAKVFPEKFEKWEGSPQPLRNELQLFGEMNPPPPPDEAAYADAELLKAMSTGLAMERAKRLRQMADRLEEQARGEVKFPEQSVEAMRQAQEARESEEGPRSHTQRFGKHESYEATQSAPEAKAPPRSEAPVPQDQSSLSPEKQKELSQAVQKEMDKAAGGNPSAEQQKVVRGQEQAPQTPGASPTQRARETQAQIGQGGQGGQQSQPSPQQGQQGQGGQPQQGQPRPPAPQAQTQARAKTQFQAMPPDKQRAEDAKLDTMNAAQLRALAEEEEIEVPQGAAKAQLIAAIRVARKG
jgi:hypothetical protein